MTFGGVFVLSALSVSSQKTESELLRTRRTFQEQASFDYHQSFDFDKFVTKQGNPDYHDSVPDYAYGSYSDSESSTNEFQYKLTELILGTIVDFCKPNVIRFKSTFKDCSYIMKDHLWYLFTENICLPGRRTFKSLKRDEVPTMQKRSDDVYEKREIVAKRWLDNRKQNHQVKKGPFYPAIPSSFLLVSQDIADNFCYESGIVPKPKMTLAQKSTLNDNRYRLCKDELTKYHILLVQNKMCILSDD